MFARRQALVYARGVPTTIEDRLVVGDVTVMIDLYRKHGAFIHTISQELVGAAADRLTQQVFTEAWQDRLEFNPSLGTVRNWLVRRARARVSKSSAESSVAVDRLIVADSLNRMDELRRRIVIAGFDATDADDLAAQLDQPVATIRANLRRGSDQLSVDLEESRPDGEEADLDAIMADGPPAIDLSMPPEVVWQAIAAELGLDTGAVTTDDFVAVDEADPVDGAADADGDGVDGDSSSESADSVGDEHDDGPSADDAADTADTADDAGVADDGGTDDDQSVDRLQELAEAADDDRAFPVTPMAAVVATVVLIVVLVVVFAAL